MCSCLLLLRSSPNRQLQIANRTRCPDLLIRRKFRSTIDRYSSARLESSAVQQLFFAREVQQQLLLQLRFQIRILRHGKDTALRQRAAPSPPPLLPAVSNCFLLAVNSYMPHALIDRFSRIVSFEKLFSRRNGCEKDVRVKLCLGLVVELLNWESAADFCFSHFQL